MKKFLIVLAFTLFATTTVTTKAYADCQQIYGGNCQNPNISINKTIQNPQTGVFVDNLGVNDAKFAPDSSVTFQVTVTNTGNTNFSHVTIQDIFPQFVSFILGNGTFDNNTRILTIGFDNLNAGQSQTFTITGRTAKAEDLPANQSITCVVNQSIVTTNDGRSSQDNAQMCIQKQVLGVISVGTPPKIPATGAETATLPILLSLLIAGLILRKKVSIR